MNLIQTKGQKIALNHQSSVLYDISMKSHLHSFQKEILTTKISKFQYKLQMPIFFRN